MLDTLETVKIVGECLKNLNYLMVKKIAVLDSLERCTLLEGKTGYQPAVSTNLGWM